AECQFKRCVKPDQAASQAVYDIDQFQHSFHFSMITITPKLYSPEVGARTGRSANHPPGWPGCNRDGTRAGTRSRHARNEALISLAKQCVAFDEECVPSLYQCLHGHVIPLFETPGGLSFPVEGQPANPRVEGCQRVQDGIMLVEPHGFHE